MKDRAAALYPDLADAGQAIREGLVWVNGFPVRNPDSLVGRADVVTLRSSAPPVLQGQRKLAAALETFRPAVAGRVVVDVGAAAGGFTRALLAAGASRVYAVDVGHGQLLGSLRQDLRVVTLERTNLAALTAKLVPEAVGIVTIDVSYVSLAAAVPQLAGLSFAPDAQLIALVKPMFELGLAHLPDADTARGAVEVAGRAIAASGWRILGAMESPVRGHHGALEFFLHAARDPAVVPR